MKNFTQLFSLVCLTAFMMASCSQTKDLAQNDDTKEHTRRYYKEYIGNKIIYHDRVTDEEAVEEESTDGTIVATEPDNELESQTTLIAPPQKESTDNSDKKADVVEKSQSPKKTKRFAKGLVTKLKKNHNDVVTGKVFTKKYHKERKAKSNGSRAVGASEIFGLLALIFGASAFTFGVAGLIFGILGVVFGIIGLDADSFWGVFALVGLILGAVGAALSFIFLLV